VVLWAHFPSVVAVCMCVMSDLELFGFVLSILWMKNVLGKEISIFEAEDCIFEAKDCTIEAEVCICEAEACVIEAEVCIFRI